MCWSQSLHHPTPVNLNSVTVNSDLQCSLKHISNVKNEHWLTRFTRGPPELPYCEAKNVINLQSVFKRKTKSKINDNSSFFIYIDDGIGLDVVHVGVAKAQLSAPSLSGADDSRSNRILEGKGAANSNHKLSRPQIRWAAQQKHRKLGLQAGQEGQSVYIWNAKLAVKESIFF